MKVLVPSNLAGVVLGKGGETIIRIQEEASIKAHMSKGNEFFPGNGVVFRHVFVPLRMSNRLMFYRHHRPYIQHGFQRHFRH